MADPQKVIRVEWPEFGMPACANQLVASSDGSSMYLMFCQVSPPVIVGTQEEQQKQLDQIESLKALPVARVVVSLDAFRAMLQVLQDQMARIGTTSTGASHA
jgi:2-methylisocitrate lyase-like PEP mutase family enzyme